MEVRGGYGDDWGVGESYGMRGKGRVVVSRVLWVLVLVVQMGGWGIGHMGY